MSIPGTFYGLDLGLSGLTSSQAAQTVTGNNIANAGTAGYTSETPDIVQGPEGPTTGPSANGDIVSNYGGGAVVNTILRSRTAYLDSEYRTANANSSSFSTLSSALDDVQSSFNEPSSNGVSEAISNFFNSVTNLQNSPSDVGVRATVIDSGEALAQSIQTVQGNLSANNSTLTVNLNDDMSQVNSLGQQIAALNKQIQVSTAENQTPNTMLDSRDLLIDQLSSLVNVTATPAASGAMNVSIGSTQLVTGSDANTVTLSSLQSRGDLTAGDVYGITQAQSSIASYQGSLNTLASTIVTQVNSVQTTGMGLDGSTGIPFFTATTGSEASTIAVNQTLVNDPSQLATAAVVAPPATTPPPSDASNATLLQNVSTTNQSTLNNQTISGYFNTLVTQLGSDTSNATTSATDTGATTTQYSNERASVEGVSTDTQMTNMMIYERTYQASAQFISTQDAMLDTLINTMFGS